MMNDQFTFYELKLKYEIDSWDLHESLKHNEQVIVIDTRSEEVYQREHIPGAVNLPHRTMNADTTRKLNKETMYVTYCDGIGCNASTKGALNMTKLGFKVKELIGGIDWWKRDGFSTEGKSGVTSDSVSCGC